VSIASLGLVNRPSTERVFCSNELAVYSSSTVLNAAPGEGTRPTAPWFLINERALSSLLDAKKGGRRVCRSGKT
jgi:hypothetical protein